MFGDPNQTRATGRIEDAFGIRDDLRKPLSSKERASMHSGAQYPYYGANGVVDYIDRFLTDCPAICLAEDCGSYGAGESSAYIITGKAWVNNHAHLLIPTVDHILRYAQTFFQLLDVNRFISGTTRSKLTQAQLKKIPFVLPGQPEREQFEIFAIQVDKLRFDALRPKELSLYIIF